MEQELIDLAEEIRNTAYNAEYIDTDSLHYWADKIEEIINKNF